MEQPPDLNDRSPTSPSPPNPTLIISQLTADQEKTLIKDLLRRIVHEEMTKLRYKPGLDTLQSDTILLKFLWNQFVLDFPFFVGSPPSMWTDIDTFIKRVNALGLSSSEERGRVTELDLTLHRLQKLAVILFRNVFRTNLMAERPEKKLVEIDLMDRKNSIENLTPVFLRRNSNARLSKLEIDSHEKTLSEEYLKIFRQFMDGFVESSKFSKLDFGFRFVNLFDFICFLFANL